jgi:tetratricopeptide (TPR) repeat protein
MATCRGILRHLFTGAAILLASLAAGADAAEQPLAGLASGTQPSDTIDSAFPIDFEMLEAVTITAPVNTAQQMKRTIQLLSLGQPGQAISELGTALALAPDSVPIRLLRGTVYGSSGQWQEAGADFESALKLQPDNPIALGGMGIVAKQARRNPEAIDLLRRSLAREENASLHRSLICTYLDANDRDGALNEMERYSALYPADKAVHLLRIDTLLKAGRGAEVEKVVDQVVATTTDPVAGQQSAVLLYGLAGQGERATAKADEAIARAPTADLLFLRAMSEKDPARQITDLHAALKLNPRLCDGTRAACRCSPEAQGLSDCHAGTGEAGRPLHGRCTACRRPSAAR